MGDTGSEQPEKVSENLQFPTAEGARSGARETIDVHRHSDCEERDNVLDLNQLSKEQLQLIQIVLQASHRAAK